MTEALAPVEIPNRALFKSAEVCDLVKLQPYVLRSWEAEFPDLGVSKAEGGPRVYRRTDVEQVVRIKHMLLVEGLTLAGARRKLQEEAAPVAADAPAIDVLIGQHTRDRLTEVKRGLQSILELLAGRSSAADFKLTAPANGHTRRAAAPVPHAKPSPAKKTAARSKAQPSHSNRAAAARRKR